MGCCSPTSLKRWTTLVGVVMIAFVIAAFATDYWIERDFDRDKIDTVASKLSNINEYVARYSHERHRGLFRECYPTKSSNDFLDNADNVDGQCFFIDFFKPKDAETSSDYELRLNLMRMSLGFYAVGMIAAIFSLFIGILLCFVKSYKIAMASSILSFVGGFLILLTITLTHSILFVESNREGNTEEREFEYNWDEEIRQATDTHLGHSYVLAWFACTFAVLDGVLYLLSARLIHKPIKDDSSESDDSSVSNDNAPIIKRQLKGMRPSMYDNPGMRMPMPIGYDPKMLPIMYPDQLNHDARFLPATNSLEYQPRAYVVDSDTTGSKNSRRA